MVKLTNVIVPSMSKCDAEQPLFCCCTLSSCTLIVHSHRVHGGSFARLAAEFCTRGLLNICAKNSTAQVAMNTCTCEI